MELDVYQSQVVQSDPNLNLKVIGAPGSGKTRCMVQRYIHLYTHEGFNPDRMLVVTYSRKATSEMLSRIKESVDLSRKAEYNISTINAFCHRLYNAWRKKIGKPELKIWEYGDPQMNPTYKAGALLGEHLGSNDMSLFEFANEKFKSVPIPDAKMLVDFDVPERESIALFNAWNEYEIWMKDNNLVDYPGQLWNVDRLLILYPVFRMITSRKYDKIICDESQDMFEQTYRILLSLSEPSSFEAYGDPSQSIYGFNGASPKEFDELDVRVKGMQTFHLANNYRSDINIVDVVNNFGPQTTKSFKTMNCISKRPGQIHISGSNTVIEQANYIAEEIEENDYRFGDVYVLSRTNSHCAIIHQRLLELGVPSYYAGKYSLWDKTHMKAGLSYMSMAKGLDTQDDLLNVLNVPSEDYTMKFGKTRGAYTPTRFLKKEIFRGVTLSDIVNKVFSVKRPQRPGISNLMAFVQDLKDQENDRGRVADIQGAISKWARFNGSDYMDVEDDLSILWDKLENLDYSVDNMKNYIKASNETRRKAKKGINKVQVMTIHAAKGLEAPHVFVTGLSEPINEGQGTGFYPGRNTNILINEENCLFYTGISRAIENLYLTFYQQSGGIMYQLSSFVDLYTKNKAYVNGSIQR